MLRRFLLINMFLFNLGLSLLVAAPRADSPPPRPLQQPDHAEVHRFHLLEGSSRSALHQLERLQREPEVLTYYDVTRYELLLEVYTEDDFITGEVLMEFDCLVTQLDTLVFHAGSNLTLFEVLQDAVPLDFSRDGSFVSAVLNNPLTEGESSSLLISYQADQQGNLGMMHATEYNVQLGEEIDIRATQSEPFDARLWWPCKDDTRDKADTVLISVTTEDFNDVVSNGILLDDIDHGDGTHTMIWEEQWPMVTYLVSVCVTRYNHIETEWGWEDVTMLMHDWSWSFQPATQQEWIDIGMMGLTAFSDLFGLYPYYNEKYGHAEYLWGGAMEHQSCSSMGFYNDWVIPHELGHQWFGDKVTCDTFHHIWLNEGWASYCEALFFEYWLGEEELHEWMVGESYWGAGTIWVEDPETESIFDGNLSYRKASWVVHMLRHVVGEESFWEGLHAYLGPNEPAFYRTVTTDEFRGFMEAASGLDLQFYFDQWIFGEYFPEYAYHWTVEPAGNQYNLTLYLLQEQVPARQTFEMPVDLVVTLPFSGDTKLRLWNEEAAQRFEILLPEQPMQALLDPDHWILREVSMLNELPVNFIAPLARFEDDNGDILPYIPPDSDFRFRAVIRNMGPDAAVVTASLLCENEIVEILTDPLELGPLDFTQYSDTLLFEGSIGDLESEAGIFTLALNADGELFEFIFNIPLGSPNLLLVDDDGGDQYEVWLEEALAGWSFYTVVEPAELTAQQLTGMNLVIWMQGDITRELTIDEKDMLGDYLAAAGHLIFTGQNFAQGQSPQWLENFCGLEFTGSDFYDQTMWGDPDEFLSGEGLFMIGGGAGNQTDLDKLAPLGPNAVPLMHYFIDQQPGNAAVVNYRPNGGAVAVFGFGWEGVAPTGIGMTLTELSQAAWDWANGLEAVPVAPVEPATVAITATYPNPFNPSLTVAYYLPRAGEATLTLYNILGERVAQLFTGPQPAGSGSLNWNATGLAGGVYFLQLQQGNNLTTEKIMLLK